MSSRFVSCVIAFLESMDVCVGNVLCRGYRYLWHSLNKTVSVYENNHDTCTLGLSTSYCW
ncbi:hypothetical protein C5167_050099 [Papaver somniferum]|uniref:Uncharacterized protein n=1 Tax=Papaver somniferum TaxID=3469 RepID=A0A4Y7KMP2_PAPSO|nr:hypothetical protein C5167_050099 [Papaver somniferum]